MSHPDKNVLQQCGLNNLQMWPPGLFGGLGVRARRPVGEEGRTDTGLVLADQPAREKEGKQNGATPTPAQVFSLSWF